MIAGGVERMTRAPFVMGKADGLFSRSQKLEDTTMGWRFINPALKAKYGTDLMPETGEIVAEEFRVSRADQDAFALRSQQRAVAAIKAGLLAQEIVPVTVPPNTANTIAVATDEHPRPDTTRDRLTKLRPIVRYGGTSTAGKAAGVSDGAAAMLLASGTSPRSGSEARDAAAAQSLRE
jgi:acetyl-CoA acetyltransferase